MALESQVPVGSGSGSKVSAPIENEIPAYRAVSPMAVGSLVTSIASVFCFANTWFVLVALLAIAMGLVALRSIKRFPDLYTGASLARAGIGLSLVFAASALTFSQVQHMKVSVSAKKFADVYAEVLESGNLADATWYTLMPDSRQGQTPKKYLEQVLSDTETSPEDLIIAPIGQIQEKVKSSKGHVHFQFLEESGFQGLTPYAFAVYEVDIPETESAYALVDLRADQEHGVAEWYVSQIRFPYELKSHRLAPKPVDDGHGHSH